ncbi:MAG: glycosyltransferase family 4 protein [Cyanomargarita calcarea GSE-NOS-MK-12-04C]|jgi:glycosyltransferase involved in cell wall biosynthesis|uniref:Glycosyltransferase family 4 protein n=1 Tax=Cyanomargarita calcarea GSE-NOS-MK-12-04C TaxID=2839659 RepID=A0A951QIR7_9CYAN|nr:glycosyltransferase family 4 protein [Cyanomargarita calcarea GSE-NOS-MK-12-04C]
MYSTKVLVAQLGARKHYQEPALFHQWGILDRFYTDIYAGNNPIYNLLRHPKIYTYLPNSFKKALDRYEASLQNANIIQFPIFGYQYIKAVKQSSLEEVSQIFVWGAQQFCHKILQHGIGNINTIYGFNSACLELFQYAKDRNIGCILDQTLADYSLVYKLLLEEEEKWIGWSLTPFKINNSDLKLMEREHHEQDLANHIVCGSSFVKDSLVARGVNANKISVISLGRLKDEEPIDYQNLLSSPQQRGDELKILFVGSVGLRKGIPYLLEALSQIKGQIPFDCKVAGSLEIKSERIAEYSSICEFLGRIPRSQVKDLYRWADVFVLPSICEGSAMVTYEALSLGVPIITTYNSGSLVRDGIDGFIVPIRDSEAIAEKLRKVYTTLYNNEIRKNSQEYLKQILQTSENNLSEILIK